MGAGFSTSRASLLRSQQSCYHNAPHCAKVQGARKPTGHQNDATKLESFPDVLKVQRYEFHFSLLSIVHVDPQMLPQSLPGAIRTQDVHQNQSQVASFGFCVVIQRARRLPHDWARFCRKRRRTGHIWNPSNDVVKQVQNVAIASSRCVLYRLPNSELPMFTSVFAQLD